ncbi:gag-polypeptide of LTR copia-type [Phytophthora infestans]|uniref:Gag-polypeptide of LTR copia-type n=1 Tax=Phytophthora infestans TaxID=4787 RepID=A0A8S9UDW5_PHYIN|nr:gag-polypeptide of LTR copia-type [Phytophthora infestans]
MEANDLWAIVTLEERPSRNGSKRDVDNFWHQERKAKSLLLETLTDDLVVSVGAKQYAYQVLEYLEQTYEAKNWRNLVALRVKFVSLRYEDGQAMTTHLNNLKTLADKLARQKKPVDDQERVCQLVTSLPESWSHFKSVYFTQDRPLPWSTTEGNVMADSSSRQAQTQPSPVIEQETAVPAVTKNEVYMTVETLLAARQNHLISRRPQSHRPTPYHSRSSNGQTCLYCGKGGHQKQVCRLRIRHLQERGDTDEQQASTGHASTAVVSESTAENATERTEQILPALEVEVWGLATIRGYSLKVNMDSNLIP